MSPSPLRPGAHWDGAGTLFAVFSSVATAVDLCLFDDERPEERLPLARSGHLWHVHVPGVRPGQRYGYRVSGPPPCDPAKLLVDPYASAIDGELTWRPELLAPAVDSAPLVPRSLVTSPYFDWDDDRPPRVPWADTVIYEAHVRGLTMTHPDVPPQERGTYRGLCHPAVVEHLRRLGVTSVELLPVHHFVSEQRLADLGLTNYWGYNTLGFFAPHGPYAAGGQGGEQVGEFKHLVRELHRAGLEVILDVVYNHTAEGGAGGPLLSLRGFDERAYYRLADGAYIDWTGCGNTLNVDHPAALRLVGDSLRHWVNEFHVDGFRFDLATTLARDEGRYDRGAAFFDILYQDPVLSQVKLIAEPWDLGPDGYQVGRFPLGWAEWNGHYRDVARDFWRGRPAMVGAFAACLAGSADRFGDPARGPLASINFVACHDGFTLADLVSHEHKHNEANGEANRDGTDDNRSANGGVEGPTDDPAVNALRARRARNLVATVFLSHGVPMLGHGDELGRSQGGNNNAYCQDNEVSWVDWEQVDVSLLQFVTRLAALRRNHPVLRRVTWAGGRPDSRHGAIDLAWFTVRGVPMTEDDWLDPHTRAFVVVLDGRAADGGQARPGSSSLVLMVNNSDSRLLGRIPAGAWPGTWLRVLDTADPGPHDRARRSLSGEQIRLEPGSLVVLSGHLSGHH